MGFYIEGPTRGKAKYILETFGAEIISQEDAKQLVGDPTLAVICVVSNALFDAAGYIFSDQEFVDFTLVDDYRPKTFLSMPKNKAEELSGYSNG